jgi:hypothetical protein
MIGNKSALRVKQGDEYINISNVTELSEFEKTRSEVDNTTYDDNATSKQLTLTDSGTLSVTLRYDENDNTHSILSRLFDENQTADFEFYINDSKGTTIRFNAGIQSYTQSFPNTENATTSVSLAINGGFDTVLSAVGEVQVSSSGTVDTVLKARTIFTKSVNGIDLSFRTVTQVTVPHQVEAQPEVLYQAAVPAQPEVLYQEAVEYQAEVLAQPATEAQEEIPYQAATATQDEVPYQEAVPAQAATEYQAEILASDEILAQPAVPAQAEVLAQTATQATTGKVKVEIICLNAGEIGNLPINNALFSTKTDITIITASALTGGTNA